MRRASLRSWPCPYQVIRSSGVALRPLDIRILGAFDVCVEGRALPLGPPKGRTVLALLVLNVNEIVSTDRMIDELWPDEAPQQAKHCVEVYVWQLRRALTGVGRGSCAIETRPPGYALRVQPDAVDLCRFERLLTHGRQSLAAGDPARAAVELRKALALWRGEALADLGAEPFVHAIRARLEDLRLCTLDSRIDAELRLGLHEELVAELRALVAAHPARERFSEQLVLALYRAGRQVEALETFRQARRFLVETYGLEPGRRLSRLEQAILRHDATLDSPTPLEPALAGVAGGPPRVSVGTERARSRGPSRT